MVQYGMLGNATKTANFYVKSVWNGVHWQRWYQRTEIIQMIII